MRVSEIASQGGWDRPAAVGCFPKSFARRTASQKASRQGDGRRSQNDSETLIAFVEKRMGEIGRETGAAIMVVHHTDRWGDIRGAWIGAIPWMWCCTGNEKRTKPPSYLTSKLDADKAAAKTCGVGPGF
jgi:hypothetical protein